MIKKSTDPVGRMVGCVVVDLATLANEQLLRSILHTSVAIFCGLSVGRSVGRSVSQSFGRLIVSRPMGMARMAWFRVMGMARMAWFRVAPLSHRVTSPCLGMEALQNQSIGNR